MGKSSKNFQQDLDDVQELADGIGDASESEFKDTVQQSYLPESTAKGEETESISKLMTQKTNKIGFIKGGL